MTTRRAFLVNSAALLAASWLAPVALCAKPWGQAFPTKPIKIIVPFPAGGPADTAVRIAQPGMEKSLGQPVIVENVAGAAGGLGAARVKQAEPDGHTLLQAASPHTTNAAVKPDANVDLLRDFVPIGQTGNSVYTLCASKALGIKTFAEMVARRQGQARRTDDRQRRRRLGASSDRRDAEGGGRHRAHARAVSRRGAGDSRPGRGPAST